MPIPFQLRFTDVNKDDVKASCHLLGNTAAHGSCSYHTDFKYLFFIQILLFTLYLNNFWKSPAAAKLFSPIIDASCPISPWNISGGMVFRSRDGLCYLVKNIFSRSILSYFCKHKSSFPNLKPPFRHIDSRLLYVARIFAAVGYLVNMFHQFLYLPS